MDKGVVETAKMDETIAVCVKRNWRGFRGQHQTENGFDGRRRIGRRKRKSPREGVEDLESETTDEAGQK